MIRITSPASPDPFQHIGKRQRGNRKQLLAVYPHTPSRPLFYMVSWSRPDCNPGLRFPASYDILYMTSEKDSYNFAVQMARKFLRSRRKALLWVSDRGRMSLFGRALLFFCVEIL